MNRRVLFVFLFLGIVGGTLVIGAAVLTLDGDGQPETAEQPTETESPDLEGTEPSNASRDESDDERPPASNDTENGADGVANISFDPPDPATQPGVLDAPANEFAEFVDMAETLGLTYETEEGGIVVDDHGVYVTDFTNDGYEDLLLIGGEYPVLYENTGGAYERYAAFELSDVLTAHFFDADNDGYKDLLLVPAGTSPVLYENTGDGFERQPDSFSGRMSYPATATAADFTGNGCLDVYIGNWFAGASVMPTSEFVEVGENHPEMRPETTTGGQNYLFANDCETFTDITEAAGVGGSEFTLAVSAADFTGNGHIDIHVGNDFTGDYIYENQGGATFEEINLGPDSDRNAMSSVAMDMTGNHLLDIFVTNVYYEGTTPADLVPLNSIAIPDGNNLFINEGDGEFRDVAPEHDLNRGAWGWAATVADYTNDGHLDIIHGSSYANLAIVEEHPEIFRPPQVWKGTSDSWNKIDGFDIGFPEHNIRGVARIDYANTGVLDFVAVGNPSQRSTPGVSPDENRAFLYQNTHENDDSLQLWIRNPDGIDRNAGVYIETSERTIYRETTAGTDLLSQDSQLIHVGLGNEAVERVVVSWPEGYSTEHTGLESGLRYIVTPSGERLVE